MIVGLISLLLLSADALVFAPKCNEPGIPSIFLFAGGAGLGPARYSPIFDKITTAGCSLGAQVWIGSPSFLADNWVTQGQFEGAVRRTLQEVEAALRREGVGNVEKIRVFYGGHSRGGVAMQDMLKNTFSKSSLSLQGDSADDGDILRKFLNGGLVLFSSALQRKYRPDTKGEFLGDDYPILTIGGELDGLFRVFRLAESAYHESSKIIERPTVVIEGANHMSFSSGDAPLFVKMNDIAAEIPEENAHEIISQVVNSFIVKHGSGTAVSDDELFYIEAAKKSLEYLRPIIDSLKVEGSYHLQPPCSELKKGDTRACWKGSAWSETAQEVMAGLPEVVIKTENEFFKAWAVFPYHHPYFKTTCDSPVGCTLSVYTTSQCVYSLLDSVDFGFSPVACDEIRGKMKSRQTAHLAAGIKDATFEDLDDKNTVCQEINAKSIKWAEQQAAPSVYERYKKRGVQLVAGFDLDSVNGGLWIWQPLKFEKTNNSDGKPVVEVRAANMRTPAKYYVSIFKGFHYCKLLSPARALEWIYTDSLK